MVKNQCEKYLSRWLKESGLWHLKLQVNPLAHTTSPADFIILNKGRYLIECKQTKGERFVFDRLTQKHGLLNFQKSHPDNRAFVMILFWKGRLKKSFLFLIDIENYALFEGATPKKSANLGDMLANFKPSQNGAIWVQENLL